MELSIVLVILGLLTGGILAGQSLIRASELRSVTTQFANYRTAAYSFRDKYFAIPGDFAKATDFWTSAGGTGADTACIAAQTTATATCNGTGDGLIMAITGWDHAERLLAWKHLANAGLVEGSYTGKSTGAVNTFVTVAGTNVAPAKVGGGAFYDFSYVWPNATLMFTDSRTARNALTIYGPTSTNGALKPEEAWNIDTKLDDGSPVLGNFYTTIKSSPVGPNCASSDLNTAIYDLAVTEKNCLLISVL